MAEAASDCGGRCDPRRMLETGFAAGPDVFYGANIPGNAPLGQYLFAAVLTEPGILTRITSCEAPFEVN